MKKQTIYETIAFTATMLIVGLLLFSCSPKLIPSVSTNTIVRTTDTITRTVPDSTALRMLFECDSLGRVRLRELDAYKGATASQEVNFSNGELRVETRWRTQYIDRFHEVRDTTVIDRIVEREVVKEVKRVPVFFWWCFGIALVSVGVLVIQLIKMIKWKGLL